MPPAIWLPASLGREQVLKGSDAKYREAGEGDRWTLRDSVDLFVRALEHWLELALWFCYEDVEQEAERADEREERAEQE